MNTFFQRHNNPYCEQIADCVLNKLRCILNFFQRQKLFQFYSSSILISYEGLLKEMDRKLLRNDAEMDQNFINYSNKICFADLVDVHMIDFTHVFNQNELDENYLHGLSNFILYVEQFIFSL